MTVLIGMNLVARMYIFKTRNGLPNDILYKYVNLMNDNENTSMESTRTSVESNEGQWKVPESQFETSSIQ